MDRASALPFPNSRTLAGWWRQLQAFQPRGLWVGHCYVHRVEAPIVAVRRDPLDPLAVHLLAALALTPSVRPCPQGDCIDAVGARLHMPAAVLRHALRELTDVGLVARDSVQGWSLTGAGRVALDEKATRQQVEERQSFPFVERIDAMGQRTAAPHYVPLGDGPALPWNVAEAEAFDPALLRQALAAPAAWKQAHDFPGNVAMVEPTPAAESAWRHILLDRPERLTLALIATDTGWFGFATQAPGWAIDERAPILRTAVPWPDLPAPTGTPPGDAWTLVGAGHLRQAVAPKSR